MAIYPHFCFLPALASQAENAQVRPRLASQLFGKFAGEQTGTWKAAFVQQAISVTSLQEPRQPRRKAERWHGNDVRDKNVRNSGGNQGGAHGLPHGVPGIAFSRLRRAGGVGVWRAGPARRCEPRPPLFASPRQTNPGNDS